MKVSDDAQSKSNFPMSEEGRRVVWERTEDPGSGDTSIKIVDADTGEVIAIVRSLFEHWFQ